jgi:hypothetical protein
MYNIKRNTRLNAAIMEGTWNAATETAYKNKWNDNIEVNFRDI